MTEKNELQHTTQNGLIAEQVVSETEDHTIVKLPNGKFEKRMKYKKVYTYVPETESEMIELYKILNTQDNPDVTPMQRVVSEEFSVLQAYTNPYQSFDEETGGNTNGVTTTILTDKGYIATSSKTVYYTLLGLFDTFGYPNTENYRPIKVKVTSTKQLNGNQIGLELIGF